MTTLFLQIIRSLSAIRMVVFLLAFLGHISYATSTVPTFPKPSNDFEQYLEDAWSYLSQNSLRHRTQEGIALNMPFELTANKDTTYRGKFLLIHGLNDSPFVWRDTAAQLVARGFDVRAILLPGHGTTPEHMLDVHYSDWLQTARQHLKLWNTDDTPLFLGGFSLGGVIATALSIENETIAGLLLFSPAYHSRLNHLLRWSWLYQKFQPWLFGGMIIEDNPAKYNSIPINSGDQYYRMTRYLKKKWKQRKIRIPTLVVVTVDDSVVDIPYVRKVFQRRFKHEDSRLIVYSANPHTELNHNEVLRNSEYLERRILNQAHLSLMNAPDNMLYGGEDGLLICNGNEYPIFMACMRSPEHWYGAQHTPSPDEVAVARTTINPDFHFVFEEFDRVFSQ
ncbi:MAG: alpha/beta fold hydrolase [Granulosicoccus sp.]|nr:alpha/beta fold hydrolase [Granulosicoccus sp.]